MTPTPDNRNRQTLQVRLRNRRLRLCGVRGGNWQKPKPDSSAKGSCCPRPRRRRAQCQPETSRVRHAARCGATPVPWGRFAPPAGKKEKAVTAKTAPRDIRGVTQGQCQLHTAVNETMRSITTQAQMQTRTQQVQLAIRNAASNTRKTVAAVHSAIRHFLASLHSLVAAIATGISVALSIIIVISLVAFVSGSAYGIFFCRRCPQRSVRNRARSRRNPDGRIPRQTGRNLRHRTARPPRHYRQR